MGGLKAYRGDFSAGLGERQPQKPYHFCGFHAMSNDSGFRIKVARKLFQYLFCGCRNLA
jgi:hypothetical protein